MMLLLGSSPEYQLKLDAMYGSGKHCYEDGAMLRFRSFSNNILDTSRDPDELLKGLDWLA